MEATRIQEAYWPLSFQINAPVSDSSTADSQSWSHELYRGPENQEVQVLYSRNIEESEIVAQQFLNEGILGFDMEWNWWTKKDANARLQERIGLIQLASEDKIGLFHIGVHPGTTPEDLICPSLRKIIEDPAIVKTGVNIVKADFSRLREWFEIDPQGAFELSHLHNLVTYGASDPFKCTTRLFSLDKHVELHLGLRLPKGDERMSRWNIPLTYKQKSYAAADAYAGFMLYHCMNAKRIGMLPQPPLPIHADKYTRTDRSTLLHLQPNSTESATLTVVEFFQPTTEQGSSSEEIPVGANQADQIDLNVHKTPNGKRRKSQSRTPRSSKVGPQNETAHPFTATNTIFSTQLFEKLKHHRLTAAKQRGCSAFIIAHNTQLQDIARQCPTTERELLEIKGVGKGKVADYGQAWLSLIRGALQELQRVELPGPPWKNLRPFDLSADVSTGVDSLGERLAKVEHQRSPEVQTPSVNGDRIRPPPGLHTGLSFSIANTRLSDDNLDKLLPPSDSQSDSSSAFETDTRSPSPSRRKRKLERAESRPDITQ